MNKVAGFEYLKTSVFKIMPKGINLTKAFWTDLAKNVETMYVDHAKIIDKPHENENNQ